MNSEYHYLPPSSTYRNVAIGDVNALLSNVALKLEKRLSSSIHHQSQPSLIICNM